MRVVVSQEGPDNHCTPTLEGGLVIIRDDRTQVKDLLLQGLRTQISTQGKVKARRSYAVTLGLLWDVTLQHMLHDDLPTGEAHHVPSSFSAVLGTFAAVLICQHSPMRRTFALITSGDLELVEGAVSQLGEVVT